MYLSNNDGSTGVDVDDNTEAQSTNTPPATSVPSQSPSVSCPTLLVIDDTSNSDESSINATNIPPASTSASSSTIQTNHLQTVASPAVSSTDAANDTPEQQRRRNSSIAKLLGGQPLNNQQYEEIHQQILDDQSAQNGLNDNNSDGGIPRSRSSITRTLLANAERNNANNNTNGTSKGRPDSSELSKNFEYLIRRELDIEHAPSTFHPNSAPSVFQNLNTARNTPPLPSSSPSQLKLKRKRSIPKVILPSVPMGKSSNTVPFALRDPFELDSSAPSLVPPLNPTALHRSHHQNELFRFDAPRRHAHQLGQQFPMSMNNSPGGNSSVYSNHKLNPNSSAYPPFSMHHDRLSSTPPSSSTSSLSSSLYSFCHYPSAPELTLPTPVSPISTYGSSLSLVPPDRKSVV